MSGIDRVQQSVLGDALAEQIKDRRVRCAVFTTFTFEPDFFELEVLPYLFASSFSTIDKVRRVQLEEELSHVDEVAVYYDQTALSQDAKPALLDFRRIGVHRKTGVFHPKVVLILVENVPPAEELDPEIDDEPGRYPLSLIVGTLSANLTRSGWWENVETGHFEEIQSKALDKEKRGSSFRRDVLGLINAIRRSAGTDEPQPSLDQIQAFLTKETRTDAPANNSAYGSHHTRLFYGQKPLPDWLQDVGLSGGDLNMEVISPFYDEKDRGTLEALIEAVWPAETRIYLPEDAEKQALVKPELYDALNEVAYWSRLPGRLLQRGRREQGEMSLPRRVHAKVYRLWSRASKKQVMLVGSVNLTQPAHSAANAGNLEAGFLVEVSKDQAPFAWWLNPLEADPKPGDFAEEIPDDENSPNDSAFVDVALRYNWVEHRLSYRRGQRGPGALKISALSGSPIMDLPSGQTEGWVDLDELAADRARDLLMSSSLARVEHAGGKWVVLIEEQGMTQKPSLLQNLTPEDILLYWSLLSSSQREQFLLEKLVTNEGVEGLPANKRPVYLTRNNVFDRFAGVFHAFERLHHSFTDALDREETKPVLAKLYGTRHDGLPALLEAAQRHGTDAVMNYLIFLCAKQLRDRIEPKLAEFGVVSAKQSALLDQHLQQLPELRAVIEQEEGVQPGFMAWYESAFLEVAQAPGGVVS